MVACAVITVALNTVETRDRSRKNEGFVVLSCLCDKIEMWILRESISVHRNKAEVIIQRELKTKWLKT